MIHALTWAATVCLLVVVLFSGATHLSNRVHIELEQMSTTIRN